MKKKDPKTATITIRRKTEGSGREGFIATSSINPYVKVFGSTRHRALSAIQKDMPRYLWWEKELKRKREGREK